ncbi:MAG: deoxyguanosinetriphosphate triphosphohydrolase [Hydrogenophilales bacterium CG03_land_8_20_14_0_80_62_28]|nr:deoxyguanosinetriphosphate triphosphohydrolase [Betaproteobacteria bacterium]OIO78656.1 MAG: deoxyguanosinetriphosphate triphosphohydrolase [Hydrogenophilaceae bacterium CG1_02_62_390]PIV22425.1 MAG: deoxyguanosinetriphosphate triphosphohydrolase [Hydrogenophilales bacterium CG03_land_8_20_14_0_80_62_28]PIW38097.1 MAG: deoxyguanosinetriphosphate triphosphohydrolase [Hydrogenophilales bacterium CG15_BIG_FIL_POST_REV_8_21_14_020_62_31]PIW72828.1 MAG: deoxyguanosinetriphosphate triphosphohydrol
MADLAPYAAQSARSRGRRYPEPPAAPRSEFQRDRDRIIHSTAFRRLEYKTQVFVNHEGDLFRTRLTHSLEVAQIGRTLARLLNLDEDLVETIALAHDLGHTPFGHTGQDALNECMKAHGGFEHNLQSLRVVDELEQKYADFDGLNLTFEAREGILKHCSKANAERLGDVGQRFLAGAQPSLEAQIVNLADEIAYNNHDVDDGLRSGLMTLDQLAAAPLFSRHLDTVRRRYPALTDRRLIHETVRRMIDTLVTDLVEQTRANLVEYQPADIAALRQCPPLAAFSPAVREESLALKRFLLQNLYRHYKVARMSEKASRLIRDLFAAFTSEPKLLPPEFQGRAKADLARAVCDYIAGMTDRYAILEHRRIFDIEELA